jgi:predicted Zn-dependent protease
VFVLSRHLGRTGRRLLVLLACAAALLSAAAYHYWPEFYLRTARQALDRQDGDTARQALERYLAVRPDSAPAHFLLAQLDRRGDRYDEAEKHLAACRRLGGPADDVRLEHVLMAVQAGTFGPAEEHYCRQRRERGDADEYLLLEAFSQGYTKTFRLNEALVCLDRLLEIRPDSGYALRRRAWVHAVQGRADRAEADYRRAVEIDPNDGVARLGLAQLLLDGRKSTAEAAEHFERLWEVRKESAVLIGLARSRLQAGRTDEARLLFDGWLADHPRDPLALTERGKLALDGRQTAEAETWLRRALALTPYAIDLNHALYLCLSQRGQAAEAEQCQARIKQAREDVEQLTGLTSRLQQTPQDRDLRCRVAQIFLRQGQEQEGERWLLLLLQADPGYRPAHQALAAHYRRTGRTAQADVHDRLTRSAPPPAGGSEK